MPITVIPAGDGLAAAAEAAAPDDVVVVAARARTAPDFAARLAAAADDVTATVAALAGEGDAEQIAQRSLRLRPRTTRLTLDCTWISRAALDLAGPLDDGFGERCSALGLLHVVADDVLVANVPATTADDPHDGFAYGDLPPRPPTRLGRALTWTGRVRDGLEVTIDGRAFGPMTSGTEVQALALLEALQRTGEVGLRVLVREGVTLEGYETITSVEGIARTALVHRPFQVSSADDLVRLAHTGERLVVTHQDLLLFHDPDYHATPDAWAGYRRLTGAALAAADMVVAITDHVAHDLVREDLVEPARLRRVYQGTDHVSAGEANPPAGLSGKPFLLQLGSDLRHKNRGFSLALVRELQALGWDGELVIAGPEVEHGGSGVVGLGPVSAAQARWLYREAAAVVFPSVSEGFGLVPFEAAAAGTLPLVAPVSAMAELLGAEALLVPWDARASAARVLPALRDPEPVIAAVRTAGAALTWDRTARELLTIYDEVLALPARAAAANAWQALAAEARRGHWEGSYHHLRGEIGPTGFALVGADGVLPEDAQRTLAALAGRRATRGPLLRALRALGRLGR